MAENVASRTTDDIIQVTPVAVEKIKGLMAEKELTEHGLRVFVAGGGCSGMQYGMAFEGNPREDDLINEIDGVRIIIDPVSLDYLRGAAIDFVDNLMGGGFRIDNPNAVAACGCGNSFRTKEEAGGAHTHGGGCGCGH